MHNALDTEWLAASISSSFDCNRNYNQIHEEKITKKKKIRCNTSIDPEKINFISVWNCCIKKFQFCVIKMHGAVNHFPSKEYLIHAWKKRKILSENESLTAG